MFALILGVDLVRTIWSWREPFELNNTLIDAVNFR
jgi:hypothetical protein